MIAANGYTVVSINYQRAPENHYPGPIIQLGEAYEFLQRDARRFPAVDLHRLIIGGDSAGGTDSITIHRFADQHRISPLHAAPRHRAETRPTCGHTLLWAV